MTTLQILQKAKNAKAEINLATVEQLNSGLLHMAESLVENTDKILAQNRADLDKASSTVSEVMLDRLALDRGRIEAMADGIRQVASLPSPVGRVLGTTKREDGLIIEKTSVPLGVVAIIYESRPNVTSDAAALAIKSGNVCVLRCGKEAHNSAQAIVNALQDGLENAGLSRDFVLLVEDVTRQSAAELMTAQGYVDLLIPRGGKGLICACVKNATVPCIQTGTGICHIYVDESADLEMALNIIENAKTSRPSVCNAEEVCVVNKKTADKFLPMLKSRLTDCRAENPVELRLDEEAARIIDGTKATEADFDTEFLDYILAVKVVDSVQQAVEHINAHSTGHSEAIITSDRRSAELFTKSVDSAAVYVNASTRFTDGGEFGLGCEMGISTQKLHARGPMGLGELTTYKYIIRGQGHIRK